MLATAPRIEPGDAAFDHAVLAAAFDPIVSIDHLGTIESASDSIERLFGWKPTELIGQNVRMLIPEPHRSAHDGYLGNFQRTGATRIVGRPVQIEAVRKDGTLVPIELCVSRARVPGRSTPVFVGIIRDVSAQRQAERELELIKTLALSIGAAPNFDEAMSSTLCAICTAIGWDHGEAWLCTDSTQLTEANWTRPGVDVRSLNAASATASLAPGIGLIGRAWSTGRPQVIPDLASCTQRQFRRAAAARAAGFKSAAAIPIKTGDTVVAVLGFYSCKPKGFSERLVEFVGAAAAPLGPVIRQKRLEEALRQSEGEFRAAFQLSALGQVQSDARTQRIRRVNPHFCEMTGYTEQELLGMSFLDLTHPDDRAANRAGFRRLVEEGLPVYEVDKRYIRKDGNVIWVHVSSALIRNAAGKPCCTIGMVQDVTERKRFERELEDHRTRLEELVRERTEEVHKSHEQLRMADRMASIGTLAAGLGHDMNNVLLPVRARINALRANAAIPASAREHVDGIRKSVAYLQQLADGLHFMAMDPEKEGGVDSSINLRTWWSQAGVLLSKAAPKHVKVTASIPPDLPEVRVPAHGLTQAVLNLIVNAGEAIPADRKRRQGRIRILAEATSEPGERSVRLCVADNGRGMTDEVRRRAFEMFFTTKTRGLGTGLGLPLVRQVMVRTGGSVQIESKPGKGTSVTLVLPAIPAPGAGETAAPHASNGALAVISVADGRTAALIGQILGASGARTVVGNEPEDADIWIVDDTATTPHAAKAWLLRRPGARLVVVGQPAQDAEEWRRLGDVMIEDRDDYEAVRTGLARAIARK